MEVASRDTGKMDTDELIQHYKDVRFLKDHGCYIEPDDRKVLYLSEAPGVIHGLWG